MAAKTLVEFQSEFRLEYGMEPTKQDIWYAAIRSVEVAPSAPANTGSPKCQYTMVGCANEGDDDKCGNCHASNFMASRATEHVIYQKGKQ